MILRQDIWSAFAGGLFKWTFIFVALVITISSTSRDVGNACILIVAAVDVAVHTVVNVTTITSRELQSKLWLDELTNRIFYKEFIEGIREGDRPEVDELFKRSTRLAAEDINVFKQDSEFGKAGAAATAIWTFCWLWLSYGVYYGAAWLIGNAMR